MVSVAPSLEEVPAGLRDWHVGGLEAGMGEVLAEMADLLEAGGLEEALRGATGLREIATRCRARV